jgi:hypothetical protein
MDTDSADEVSSANAEVHNAEVHSATPPGRSRLGAGVRRRLIVVAVGAVLVSLVLAVWLVANRHSAPPTTISLRRTPYLFVWRQPAPGMLSAADAFDAEARVLHYGATSAGPPTALWVAQSEDAALVLVQLDTAGQAVAPVILARSSSGTTVVWQGYGAAPFHSERRDGATVSKGVLGDGLCTQSERVIPGTPELWMWSAGDGSVGAGTRFASSLTALYGGEFDGVVYHVASATSAEGGVVIVVGTGDQATLDTLAARLAQTSAKD